MLFRSCEGIHARYLQGKTVGAGFERIGETVVPLLEWARAALGDGGASEGMGHGLRAE